jgi:Family of unknown function (DUF5715)
MRKLLTLLLMILCVTSAEAKRHQQSRHGLVLLPPSRQSLLLQNQMINQMGLERIGDERRLSRLVEDGTLVALPINDAVKIAPSLPSNRRYVLPMVVIFLEKIAPQSVAEVDLPLQVNSAVRPVSVQRRLRRFNASAAPIHGETASSHEAGCTIDLERSRMTRQQRFWLQIKLLQYQALGYILVEEESRCFHIMVLKEIE